MYGIVYGSVHVTVHIAVLLSCGVYRCLVLVSVFVHVCATLLCVYGQVVVNGGNSMHVWILYTY